MVSIYVNLFLVGAFTFIKKRARLSHWLVCLNVYLTKMKSDFVHKNLVTKKDRKGYILLPSSHPVQLMTETTQIFNVPPMEFFGITRQKLLRGKL